MNKLEVYDEKNLIKNPFEYSLQIPVTSMYSSNSLTKNMEDGVVVHKEILLEQTQSVKIYYCSDCKQYVANLSDKAQRLYLHILYTLKPNKDYIQINSEYYMKSNNIKSINTFKEALKELIRYNFIAPTEYKTVFWINPYLYFAGNRLTKYPNNIVKTKTWDKTNLYN